MATAALLLGCADERAPDPEATATGAATTGAATAAEQTTPAQTHAAAADEPTPPETEQPQGEWDHADLPPELAELFPEGRIEQMVSEVEAAYYAHYEVYNAAAATGFADPDLMAELLATVDGDTREALSTAGTTFADAGRVVNGETVILAADTSALFVGENGGAGVELFICLRRTGEVLEADGTVAYEYSGDEQFVVAMFIKDDGRWIMVSQRVQEQPCPVDLVGP